MAVQKFIQDAFVCLVNHDLNNAANPKKPTLPPTGQVENPVMALHQLIQTHNGTLETQAHETDDKRWQVRIVARFSEKSLPFSHARTSSSKQKAKTEASRDMLTYLSGNPDVCQHLQVAVEAAAEAADAHVLPISENDYCHLFAADTNSNHTRPALRTLEWSGESANLSQSSHEEAALLLENLFLDSKMDVDSDPRQIKRQRQSTQEVDSSGAVKTEAVDPQLQQPKSTNVTYIKDEDTFQPFSQPPEQPLDEMTTTRHEKIVKYFQKLFATHRLVLLKCRTEPGQSKSVFLSFVVQHQDELLVNIAIQQGGDSHTPLFHAQVVLCSKTKQNVFLTTEGYGRKKKDAEQQAFNKMIEIVTNWNAMI